MTKNNIIVHRARAIRTARTPRRSNHTRLHTRRARARVRLAGFFGVLVIFLITLIFVGLWQPSVRITHITITTGDTVLLPVIQNTLVGTYAFIVPRDSIFFFSAARVRAAVLVSNPTIAAVSVVRTGFDSISVTPDFRTALAIWCGKAATTTPADTLLQDISQSTTGSCYSFDATGFLYASTSAPLLASTSVSSAPVHTHTPQPQPALALAGADGQSTAPLVPYIIYDSLTASSSTAFLNTVANSTKLSGLFDFARHLRTFGARVTAIVIRGDEVDFFLAHGTRITFVLGDEQNADRLLTAVKNKISISDGSLIYVDLRFHGKVYFLLRHNIHK